MGSTMKHYGDVSKINGGEIEPVDVITFGSPCQDMSVAGKRSGMKHAEQGDEETTRSGLFYEAIRIIEEMRDATNGEYPKFAVWENVPGAFSSNKGRDFHAVLEALCSVCDDTVSIPEPYDRRRTKLVWNKAGEIVGDNYSIAWRTLDAQYWGVPQRRRRIFLVADFTGRRAGEILFKPDGLRGNLPQGNEAGQEVTADAVGGVDGSVGVECLGYDMYNQASTGDKTRTLKTPAGGDDLPVVCVLNDQGGSSINVENEEVSPTLRANSHQHEPVIAFSQNQREEVRDLGDKAGALAAEAGVHQQTYVAQPVIALQANGIDRADAAGCNGCGWRENESYTLNTVDRHAVCFEPGAMVRDMGNRIWTEQSPTIRAKMGDNQPAVCFDRATFNQGINAQYDFEVSEEGVVSTVVARGPCGVCYDQQAVCIENHPADSRVRIMDDGTCQTLTGRMGTGGGNTPMILSKAKPPRKYIIRRLTPTECARLQGFPDWWGYLAPYNPEDAEFWEDVRKTHAEINGKKYKPVKDLEKWYNKLHTDSAEYKMWGNGIALPNAEFVLHGIAEQGAKTLGSLFDGSGGFPLAGVMNGITPLWASEVEPYPIAVTKSRFGGVKQQ